MHSDWAWRRWPSIWDARPGDQIKTFGYQRTGVLAAFINALTLVFLAAILLWESYRHLINPEPVADRVMMVVAFAGLLLNLGIAKSLGGHHHHSHDSDLNVRAAWIHMMGDAASCCAIIVGAFVIHATGWLIIDPILSILIALAIVWTAWDIFKDSLNILLEGLPKGLKLPEVVAGLRDIQGVIDVHDLHIWSLGSQARSQARALSCHVLIEDMPPSESNSILCEVNRILCDRFSINHSTIQFEHTRCELADVSCAPGRKVR